MSDRGDPGRPEGISGGPERYGNVGQDDPHADPVTEPALRPLDAVPGDERTVDLRVDTPPAEQPTTQLPQPQKQPQKSQRTVASGLYVGLVLAALVLIFLLIFILQNDAPVIINFLWLSGQLPSGVALLLAAIAGVLLVAIPGSGRIVQLRRAARRAEKGR
ncbi:MAG: lipopolysaccharide assembly LapA domain-containing protein [Pseudonocardia sp.]